MKTLDMATVAADPVISEVRRAKITLARGYGFDVIAMVRALRQIDDAEKAAGISALTDPSLTTSAIPVDPPREEIHGCNP
jgi:hypothetical protein